MTGSLFKNKTDVSLRCVVTPKRIRVWLNESQILDVPEASIQQFSVMKFMRPQNNRCLFLGTWKSAYEITDAKLAPLSIDDANNGSQ